MVEDLREESSDGAPHYDSKKLIDSVSCSVKTMGDRDNKVLLLHAEDGKNSMAIISNATVNLTPADKTKLVFSRYGNQYFLSQVWVNGAIRGHQLPKSNREKEVAKAMARNSGTEQVEVVASIQ